jgi:predicted kinase
MGNMMDIARRAAAVNKRSSAESTRREMFSAQARRGLQEQWRHAAHKSSRVYLHLFNESEGQEFYVTGWDGHETITALTNDGLRNASLNEVRGCKVDGRWDDKTMLWAVMEDHDYASDKTAAPTRMRYNAFDTMFESFQRVTGQGEPAEKSRKIVGPSRKFAMNEAVIKPKWIVAVNQHNQWKAATSHFDLPLSFLPVEVVRAMDEMEAITLGRELHESGSAQFATKLKSGVSPFIRGAGDMTLDMDALIEEAILSEASGKRMIIMRGLPGSGKSTTARKAARGAKILSTDDFFMRGGKYNFDPSKIVKAHQWNQKRAEKALAKGVPSVVIDNTNVQLWEMKAYVEMAQKYGYDVEFKAAKSSWAWDVEELAKRNTHGVPLEAIKRMKSGFQSIGTATVDKVLAARAPWE